MADRLTTWTYQVAKMCPACSCAFSYEKLLTRKVAAKARDWRLRNVYDALPGGMPDPLVYSLAICPACTLTAVESEFDDARIKIDTAVRESAAHEGRALLKKWGITSAALEATRDLRLGLVSYLLADTWYRARSGPIRAFRIGWIAYRRAWMIELAAASGMTLPWDAGRAVTDALVTADEFLEQGYVKESLPDGLYVGPDYGVNFGQEAIPYMIAATNYMLLEAPGTDRAARHARALKFLSMSLQAVSRSGSAELRVKIEDLKPLLKAVDPGVAAAAPPGVPVPLPSGQPPPAPSSPATKSAFSPVAEPPDRVFSQPLPASPPRPVERLVGERPAGERPAGAGLVESAGIGSTTETVEWAVNFEPLFARHGCSYGAGEIVVREGSADRDLYFILDGVARVTRAGGEEERVLALLGKGAFFGEMSLLDGAPRFATVRAIEPLRAIRIGAADFETIIRSAPAIALRIMEVLARRLKAYDAFVQSRLVPIVETTHVVLPPVERAVTEAGDLAPPADVASAAEPRDASSVSSPSDGSPLRQAARPLSLELESLVAEVWERGPA